MAAKKELDPEFLLKTYSMLMSFSPEVTFFDVNIFSVSNERCTGKSQDEEGLKACASFLRRKFSFLEG